MLHHLIQKLIINIINKEVKTASASAFVVVASVRSEAKEASSGSDVNASSTAHSTPIGKPAASDGRRPANVCAVTAS